MVDEEEVRARHHAPAAVGRPALICGGLAVCASAALLSLRSGRVGYEPLDQSIIFDGGYRILHGQLPFRDFVAPAAVAPSFLQAAFFATCGTTWFAYCLHAAVIDALFTVLVYGLVRLVGGGSLLSWAWAALSGVILCPTTGTPLADHFAFFFGLAAVVATLAAGSVHRPAAALALAAAVAPLLSASILSKPSLAPCLAPVLVAAVWRAQRGRRARLLAGVGLGIAGSAAIACLVGSAAGIPWNGLAESFWQVPLWLGRGRVGGMTGERARELWDVALHPPLLSPFALLLVAGWLAMSAAAGGRRTAASKCGAAGWPDLALGVGLFAAGICFALITFRTTWTSWGYLFVALGSVHTVAMRHLDGRPVTARALTAVLLVLAVHDAAYFQLAEVETHAAKLLVASFVPPPGEKVRLPRPLAYLKWAMPPYNGYPWQDLAGTAELLSENEGNFWLVGDSSILYALTGRPSVHPTLWMLPPPEQPGGTDLAGQWEQRLLQNLVRYRVQYVVLEHAATQMGVSLDTFPCVAEAARRAVIDRRKIGAFTVLRVRLRAWERALKCNASSDVARRSDAPGAVVALGAHGTAVGSATITPVYQRSALTARQRGRRESAGRLRE
ncbi:MAG: hypothetical protein JOZ15_16840 [Acidobacteria bacterium]|nr:hypothetical protein [Acidobacteriota bacterium]